MYQLFAVLISFSIIPILIKRKVKLSYTLLITSGILGLISNIGMKNILDSILSVFINSNSRSTVLTVMMVSILGGLMGHYNFLEKIVRSLEKIIRNKRNIFMIIPAFIGLLVIPGGALLSAPFINDLGKELKLPPARRAAINLVFRHIAMFIVPYSTGLLLILSSFPQLSIARLVAMNLAFIIPVITFGYILYIKDIDVEIPKKREDFKKNLVNLLILTSPVYIPVVLNLISGWPFYLTLIFSILVIYTLSDKKNFAEEIVKSISWHTILTFIAILITKETILRMDGLLIIFTNLFNNSGSVLFTLFIFFVTAIFFGFIIGNQSAALAIILPMLSQLDVSMNMLYIYIYFAFGATFMGYFFSPLHL